MHLKAHSHSAPDARVDTLIHLLGARQPRLPLVGSTNPRDNTLQEELFFI